MTCKCPKAWCYHRPDCVRGASLKLAEAIADKFAGAAPWRADIDRRQAMSPAPAADVKPDDDAPPLPSNGPQVVRLELLMKRHDELVEQIERTPNAAIALRRAAEMIADAIDRVQHENTPLDWRKAS